jgi:hypothetical protein
MYRVILAMNSSPICENLEDVKSRRIACDYDPGFPVVKGMHEALININRRSPRIFCQRKTVVRCGSF